ncbi:MAG: acyltransferase [Acidiferrobacterales bacterium]|nr:acyltransferase [Acidiferrobacterales bacterium]
MLNRFHGLDAFRGLFALCIVVFHLSVPGSITELAFFKSSELFVEFFFVLSGFVLVHSLHRKKELRFRSFISARFFRLYPLHFCMFLVIIFIEIVKYCLYKHSGLTLHGIPFTGHYAVKEVIPNLLLLHSWTPYTEPLSFNYPSWSISLEFYMYILLFMSLKLFKQYAKFVWIIVSTLAMIGLVTETTHIVKIAQRGLSCFFAGALTYQLYLQIKHIRPNLLIATVLEITLVISVIYSIGSVFPHKSVILSFIFTLTVLLFAFEAGPISSLLKTRIPQYLGRISYSVYMTHAPLLFLIALIVPNSEKTIALHHLFNGNTLVVSQLIVVIVFAGLSYRHIEQRFKHMGRKFQSTEAGKLKAAS